MISAELRQTCEDGVDYLIDRMHYLVSIKKVEEAVSVHEEIQDWIIQKNNIEVLSLTYLEDYQ